MTTPPVIYNLFPRLVGAVSQWPSHTERAGQLGFNWIYINPIQYPGFSGSLYAIKDFYRLNPLFIPADAQDPMEAVRRAVEAIHDQGLKVMIDLVVNHTAKDCPLIKAHPTWFRRDREGYVVSPSAIDPADARKVTVWGDLAEVDNARSPDRAGLWAYWTALVQFWLDLGFDGFRCDAAYKVPEALWEQLISAARRKVPEAAFFAETLGCRLAEARTLRDCGFDYFFNSSKWWNFDQSWALDQHAEFGAVAPSVSFPESHDTERLMRETDGLLAVQRQRYALAAAFSEGLLMPVGYEFGFRNRLDVVGTSPDDWEDTGIDLSPFIGAINRLKIASPLLACEGHWDLMTSYDQPTIVLCKRASAAAAEAAEAAEAADHGAVLAINKDWHRGQTVQLPDLSHVGGEGGALRVHRVCRDRYKPSPLSKNGSLQLEPAEVVYILPQE